MYRDVWMDVLERLLNPRGPSSVDTLASLSADLDRMVAAPTIGAEIKCQLAQQWLTMAKKL